MMLQLHHRIYLIGIIYLLFFYRIFSNFLMCIVFLVITFVFMEFVLCYYYNYNLFVILIFYNYE